MYFGMVVATKKPIKFYLLLVHDWYSHLLYLRTVPTIVIVHTFCTSQDTEVSISGAYTNAGIFYVA